MKFYLGADHAGYKAKEALKKYLNRKGIGTMDLGAFSIGRVDYPDFALKVAKKVAKDKKGYGLLVCGTGIGMSITANKVKGIRAANPFNAYTARVAKEHNDANIICLGGRTYSIEQAKKILGAFIKAKRPSGTRHKKRVKKISGIESGKNRKQD